MNKNDDKIREELNTLIAVMSDEQFWKWVSNWYDEQSILDIVNDWDTETKKNAIIEIRKIIKKKV